MNLKLAQEFLQLIDREVQSRPAPIVFEMAYQARIAIDRIKFAIRHTEQFAPKSDPIRDANMQLFDALNRLQSAERHFQQSYSWVQYASDAKNRNGLPPNVKKGESEEKNAIADD
jgi:hypothetical protein